MPPAVEFPTPPDHGMSHHPLWAQLSVNPNQIMRLKNDVNAHFKAGNLVMLSDEVKEAYSSPTKYPGQEQENKDNVSSVRIYKWTQQVTTATIETGPGYRIQHAHLVDPKTHKVKAGARWEPGAQVRVANTADLTNYYTIVYPARIDSPGGKTYPIRNHLVGEVAQCLTPSGAEARARDSKRAVSQDTSMFTYVVRFGIMTREYVWLPCKSSVPVVNLERLTQQEIITEKKRITQTRASGQTRELVSYKEPSVDYPIASRD